MPSVLRVRNHRLCILRIRLSEPMAAIPLHSVNLLSFVTDIQWGFFFFFAVGTELSETRVSASVQADSCHYGHAVTSHL